MFNPDTSRVPPTPSGLTTGPTLFAPTLQNTFTRDWDLIASFLFECESRNLSPHSIRNYRDRLRLLCKYAKQKDCRIFDITARDLQQYIHSLLNMVSTTTINGRLTAFRCFYNWVVRSCERDGIEIGSWRNPMKYIPLLKTDPIRRPVLSTAQVVKMLTAFDIDTFHGVRNRLAVLLMYDTMIRVGELTNLQFADVNIEERTLRVTGKSRRERFVPMSTLTANDILGWMHRFRQRCFGTHLICYANGDPLVVDRVRKMLVKHGKRLGIKVYHHLLRHSGATQFTVNGGSITVLQQLMGHSDIRTTQLYQHPNSKQVTSEHDNYGPLTSISKPRTLGR